MSWQCQLVTKQEFFSKIDEDARGVPIGWMYYDEERKGDYLSDYYRTHNEPNRPPLWIKLPGGIWCMDARMSGSGEGWTITGEVPNITASPSINQWPNSISPGYHGFLVNGIISDDLEGRKYGD